VGDYRHGPFARRAIATMVGHVGSGYGGGSAMLVLRAIAFYPKRASAAIDVYASFPKVRLLRRAAAASAQK